MVCDYSEVIETRIMDITVHAIASERGLHLVGAGYSDSVVRVSKLLLVCRLYRY